MDGKSSSVITTVSRSFVKSMDDSTAVWAIVTLGIITISPAPALMSGEISLPTSTGISHQPRFHAFTPSSPQSRAYSASFSGTVRGIGPRELETRYVVFSRIGNSSRKASSGSGCRPCADFTVKRCRSGSLTFSRSVAHCAEFRAGVPGGNGARVSQSEPKPIHNLGELRCAAQIKIGPILVGRLVIAVGGVVFRLLQTPSRWMANDVVAAYDGDRRNSGLREGKVIGAIEVSLLRMGVGRDSDAFGLH